MIHRNLTNFRVRLRRLTTEDPAKTVIIIL